MLLHETKLFIDGLNKVAKQFSSLLFWTISMSMVCIVVLTFISITQLMDAEETMEWQRKMIFISNGGLAFGSLYLIFQLCHMSEILAVSVVELKEFIINDLLDNNGDQSQCQHKGSVDLLSHFMKVKCDSWT